MEFTKEQLVRAAWLSGNLDYLVQPHQEEVWAAMKSFVGLENLRSEQLAAKGNAITQARKLNALTLNIARRFGKTSLSFLLLCSLCIKNRGHIYRYVAPTEEDAKEIISEIAAAMFNHEEGPCPDDLKPKFAKGVFTFNNGSQIKVGGTWNGGDGLRGRKAHGIIVDEAAHIPQNSATSSLSYVLGAVLMPQLQTTKGFVIIASTPPRNLKHDYARILNNAEQNGTLLSFDIYANSSLTDEEIENIKAQSYSIDPTGSAWKREYLALMVPDANDLIIPEEILKEVMVQDVTVEHFEHLHRYIAFDHGTKDLNVILFAFYDYEKARVIVQRELVLRNGPNTDIIANEIARVKQELWGELPVYRSICDSISRQIIVDLNSHEKIKKAGIYFQNPSKVDLEAMVNQLIVAIGQGRYVIQPECAVLLDTLSTATWQLSNSTGKRQFARLGDIGHCDALACLVYLQRALVRSVNPLIGNHTLRIENVMILPAPRETNGNAVFQNIFDRTKSSTFKRNR